MYIHYTLNKKRPSTDHQILIVDDIEFGGIFTIDDISNKNVMWT